MYKVLLVDDEPLALEGMKLFIDWEAFGIEIVGECEDGEEALEAIDRLAPDIVFTDIRMPAVDGLELIERAAADSRGSIHFVVLSGYSDFEYAQRALRCGVTHYLLKPVIPQEASAVLEDLCARLAAERFARVVRERGPIEGLLHRIVDSGHDALLERTDDEAAVLRSASMRCPEWRAVLIEWNGEDGFIGEIRQLADRFEHCYVLARGSGAPLIVHGAADGSAADAFLGELSALLPPKRCRIAVGAACRELEQLGRSYQSARALQKALFYEEGERVIHSAAAYGQQPVDAYAGGSEDGLQLLEAIEWGSASRLKDEIARLSAEFRMHRTDPDWIVPFIEHLAYRCLLMLQQLGIDIAPFAASWERLSSARRIFRLEETLERLALFAEEVCGEVLAHRGARGRHPIAEAEQYIRQHYREAITVKELADRLFMNAPYLGQAFAARFGRTILEYVHDLRIEDAMRQMQEEPQRKMADIAESVGYEHYNHFLREFEKRHRSTPSRYASDCDTSATS